MLSINIHDVTSISESEEQWKHGVVEGKKYTHKQLTIKRKNLPPIMIEIYSPMEADNEKQKA